MQNRVQKKKKISLTTMIFIALLAGALAGVIINYLIPSNYVVDDIIVQGVFYIVGQGFIRLMRMLVVPLVFCSIVCGSMAVGDTKKAWKRRCEDTNFLSVYDSACDYRCADDRQYF